MGAFRREKRRVWPAGLAGIGLLLALPHPWTRSAAARLDEVLVSVAGRVHVPLGGTPAAHALEELGAGPEDWVLEVLEDAGHDMLPPETWNDPGRFAVVPVGEQRSAASLALVPLARIPEDQPALLGNVRVGATGGTVLVGFTRRVGKEVGLSPVTAAGTRIAAYAEKAGGARRIAFVAVGDGQDTLQVVGPERRFEMEVGDLVWADPDWAEGAWPGSWRPPAGQRLLLGTLCRDATDVSQMRVDPAWRRDLLEGVAIAFPEQDPVHISLEFEALGVSVSSWDLPPRRALLLPCGREAGVERELALVRGSGLVGRVERAGWGAAVVRRVEDPGFRLRVLLLRDGTCRPWLLEVAAEEDGGRLRLRRGPEEDEFSGAEVVTDRSSRRLPPGLSLGVLQREGTRWFLRRALDEAQPLALLRPLTEELP